ncbi:hypothetical protein [Pseudarthrobacter sp. NIBRBAC000502771]|uniref:hypothetical protein n=1 Tax=Pseudarthrobacter sp. NIBRBAC000502771 TaxID=2590774 RepID=UPI00143D3F26|nr:hypothetical protein [Pseudarthrobacter sp. NIBRBAC000502771]
MKPIKVYQCKGDCCDMQKPSKRFWIVETPQGAEVFTRFPEASFYAGHEALSLPHEVTA